jgi:hypothetical protein
MDVATINAYFSVGTYSIDDFTTAVENDKIVVSM